MEIISALCEVHPQLRVANLYIRLSNPGGVVSTASVMNNSLCLEATEDGRTRMVLKFPVSIKLLDNYKFQPTVIDEEYIHLRMPIGVPQGKKSGSENVEVLDLAALSGKTYKSQGKMFNPTLEKEYRIQCTECQSVFMNRVHFSRVLPLPRASWSEAASDWYCHVHSGEANHQKLIPRSTDCLFGSCYHALSSCLLVQGSLACGGRELLCSKCQSSVGLMEDDGCESITKLWCHSVQWFVNEDTDTWTVASNVTMPLQAFYFTLFDALEEEKSFFGRKLAFRDGDGVEKSLILWFVGDNGVTLESNASGNEIELRKSELHKVLYKSANSANDKIPCDVSEYQVSSLMMSCVLEVLRNSTKQLPPGFRTAAGFSIGYLCLSWKMKKARPFVSQYMRWLILIILHSFYWLFHSFIVIDLFLIIIIFLNWKSKFVMKAKKEKNFLLIMKCVNKSRKVNALVRRCFGKWLKRGRFGFFFSPLTREEAFRYLLVTTSLLGQSEQWGLAGVLKVLQGKWLLAVLGKSYRQQKGLLERKLQRPNLCQTRFSPSSSRRAARNAPNEVSKFAAEPRFPQQRSAIEKQLWAGVSRKSVFPQKWYHPQGFWLSLKA